MYVCIRARSARLDLYNDILFVLAIPMNKKTALISKFIINFAFANINNSNNKQQQLKCLTRPTNRWTSTCRTAAVPSGPTFSLSIK